MTSVAVLAFIFVAQADSVSRTGRATVRVSARAEQAHGSGVLVNRTRSHAYVLTAAHILGSAATAVVQFPGGKTYRADVVARTAEADLAVLRFATGDDLPAPLKFAPAAKPVPVPFPVTGWGWEAGESPTALADEVESAVKLQRPGETNAIRHWKTTKKQAIGRSGGPLLNRAWRIVGVASGHDGKNGYYVHVDEINTFLLDAGLEWLAEEK